MAKHDCEPPTASRVSNPSIPSPLQPSLIRGLHAVTITPDGEVIAEHLIDLKKGCHAKT